MLVSETDVVIVGAGPGGSAAAAHLAPLGHDVLVLDKDHFPREKTCGDGLTPRVVRELEHLGLHDEATGRPAGWARQRGLRIHGGRTVMELPWPELDDWPDHSLTCTRTLFDHRLVDHARARGATVREGTTVIGPVRRARDGRVTGVRWRDEHDQEGIVHAKVVLAADGPSSRFAKQLGLERREDRPMAVAVRTYYASARSDDEWISSFLDLRDADGDLLSGYGWIFPLDDGTINVGLGLLNTSKDFGAVNYRRLLEAWAGGMADDWGTVPGARRGPLRSAPIPMGFNRTPLHHAGVLLVGDAAGMVNPFNGEGISYAMESARLAAEIVDAAIATRRTAVLDAYDRELRARWGGYYTLGNVFSHLVGHPAVMHLCTEYGMPIRPLMAFVFKLMAHLADERPSDVNDAVITTLSRVAPAA